MADDPAGLGLVVGDVADGPATAADAAVGGSYRIASRGRLVDDDGLSPNEYGAAVRSEATP
jgi:hypothetical protein